MQRPSDLKLFLWVEQRFDVPSFAPDRRVYDRARGPKLREPLKCKVHLFLYGRCVVL